MAHALGLHKCVELKETSLSSRCQSIAQWIVAMPPKSGCTADSVLESFSPSGSIVRHPVGSQTNSVREQCSLLGCLVPDLASRLAWLVSTWLVGASIRYRHLMRGVHGRPMHNTCQRVRITWDNPNELEVSLGHEE